MASKRRYPRPKTVRSGMGALSAIESMESQLTALNNFESGTNLEDVPAVALEDEQYALDLYYWRLDPKITEIEDKLIEDTSYNREWCFNHDNLAQLVAFSIARLMVGDGVKFKSDNEEVVEYLNYWSGNVRKTYSIYSLSSMIRDIIVDNLKHGEALFVKKEVDLDEKGYMSMPGVTKKPKEEKGTEKKKTKSKKKKKGYRPEYGDKSLAVMKIDMRSVRTIEHEFFGLKKWIQYALVEPRVADAGKKTGKVFYDKDYIPGGYGPDYGHLNRYRAKIHTTQITDRQAVHFNLYTTPPIKTVMQEISYKRWIIWAMRVAAERTAIPERWAKVGTAEDHPPDDEYEDVLENAINLLQESRAGDVHAIPYNWEFGHIDMSRSSMDFTRELNYLNEQIVLGLGSHMSLYQASGSDLATSTVIEDMLIRAVAGMRKEISLVMEELFRDVLRMAEFDVDEDKNDFELVWEPLKAEAYRDFVDVIVRLAQTDINGKPLLEDRNEARKLLEPFLNLDQIKNDEDASEPFPVDPPTQPLPPGDQTPDLKFPDAQGPKPEKPDEKKKPPKDTETEKKSKTKKKKK